MKIHLYGKTERNSRRCRGLFFLKRYADLPPGWSLFAGLGKEVGRKKIEEVMGTKARGITVLTPGSYAGRKSPGQMEDNK